MSNKKKSRNSLVVIVVIGAAVLAYVWYVFLPGMRDVQAMNQELNTKLAVLAKTPQTRDAIAAVEKEMASTDAYTADWRSQHAGSSTAATMFGSVAETMRTAGVMTTQFVPEEPVSYETLEKLPLKVHCRGTFSQIGSLIRGLESLPFDLQIDQLTMERLSEDSEDLTCQLTLAIFTNKNGNSN